MSIHVPQFHRYGQTAQHHPRCLPPQTLYLHRHESSHGTPPLSYTHRSLARPLPQSQPLSPPPAPCPESNPTTPLCSFPHPLSTLLHSRSTPHTPSKSWDPPHVAHIAPDSTSHHRLITSPATTTRPRRDCCTVGVALRRKGCRSARAVQHSHTSTARAAPRRSDAWPAGCPAGQ